MRRVFSSHSQVCHVWAQQSQSEGRASRIFFEGPSIYSYGRHFEMARFIDAETVFITSRGYSVSTAKHLSLVRQAVSHKTVYTVPTMNDHAANVTYFIEQAKSEYDKATRAIKWVDSHIHNAERYVNQARAYMTQFKVKVPGPLSDLWLALHTETYLNGDVQAELLEKAKAAKVAERAAIEVKRVERERQEAASLALWMKGEVGQWMRFSAMRLRVKNDKVQTTHGAEVPIIEARKIYRALKAGVDVVGQRVGYFTVNRLTAIDIVIGCHTIPLAEIERIAPEVMSAPLVEV